MALIDTSTEFGQRVQRRLDTEPIIWLTTQGANVPQPTPVWFLPDGDDDVLIYSQPDKPKIRNIEARPAVALNFNASETGGDVVIFRGEARVDRNAPAAVDHAAFIDKYRNAIAGLGMTPQSFSDAFSVPIRVTLTKLRGF